MKKKVIAAVLALLMVASSMPMNEFSSFLPTTDITASAANNRGTVKVDGKEVTWAVSTDSKTKVQSLVIKPETLFFDNTTNITVNTAKIKQALLDNADFKENYSLDNMAAIELNYNFSERRSSGTYYHSNLAHIDFSGDTFITRLGNSMFASHPYLQTIKLSGKITSIASSAFSGCTNFIGQSGNTVDLKNVEKIESSAFQGCTSLAGVNFSAGKIKSIGDNAFANCTGITSLSLPASLESIGNSSFQKNSTLKTIEFAKGSNLASIGDNAFNNCSALSNIKAEGASNTLPAKLATIGKNAFQNDTSLQKITLNKVMLSIPEGMFNGCTSLSSVVFPAGSQIMLVDKVAFQKCTALTTLELPSPVKYIAAGAFNGCTKLQKLIVPDDFEAFINDTGASTFASCPVLSLAPKSKASSLKANQIIIPDNVKTIPTNCFDKCTGITSVVMDKVTFIDGAAFQNCTSLPSVTIPDAVERIRENVFAGCTSLKTVVYSKKLTEIELNAFKKCTSLSTLTPSGTKAITGAIQVPASCGTIGNEAFSGCTSLKYINFLGGASSTFANMGTKAFSGCTALEGATSNGTSSQELKFPKGVEVIHPSVFENCTSLKKVQFDGNVSSVGENAFSKCTSLTDVIMNPTITQIGQGAFKGCSSLQRVPVTASGACAMTQLTQIQNDTFSGCTSLKEVDLSTATKLESLNQNAFNGCTALKKLLLPQSGIIQSIGNSAFNGCTELALVATASNATKSSLPKSIISIGNDAFKKTALADVTIYKPNNANYKNTIGTGAFADCPKLVNVDLSQSNLEELPKTIFSNDAALKSVKLPKTLVSINESAFSGCTSLSTINSTTKGTANLPANLKTIGKTAFQNNHCLATIIIPKATDNIDLSAWNFSFTYTQADLASGKINPLKAFVVDASNPKYKSIDGVLYNKSGTELIIYPTMKQGKEFTVPSSVTSITQSAFSSNDYIEKVTIGNNVSSIDKNAFNKCEALKAVYFGSNKTVKFDNSAFTGLTGNPKLAFYAAKGSTAQAYANKYSSTITFIDNNMMATKLAIKQGTKITLPLRGGSTTLEAVLTTKSGAETTDVLTWTSSNIAVVSIDNNGRITPRTKGTANITVTSASGLKAVVQVTVNDSTSGGGSSTVSGNVKRIAGTNRFSTAAEISKASFTTADTVVLAYGLNYADALAGVTLANKLNAPILLTHTAKLPDETLAEIKRLKAKKVIILGGTGAIGKNVEALLKKNGVTTERVAGTTRFGTATAIAKKLNSKPTEVFFVYAFNYADALSVSTVAALKNAPIIYLKTSGDLDADTKAYLKSIKGKVKNAYVIGGKGVISDDMMKKAGNALGLTFNKTITRVAGKNRYATCVEVNKKFASTLSGTGICVAKGLDFPDALAGGVFAAKNKAPLFLADGALKDEQVAYLKSKKAQNIYVFGGTGAVPDALATTIKNTK